MTEETDLIVNDLGVRRPRQRNRVQTVPQGESLTKQADLKNANIHSILRRAQKTGLLPSKNVNPLPPDTPSPDSYHDALNLVTSINSQFENLPVDIRQKFQNDPAQLLAAAKNPENHAMLYELGFQNFEPVSEEAPAPAEQEVESVKDSTAEST